jgi:hypothetical protein
MNGASSQNGQNGPAPSHNQQMRQNGGGQGMAHREGSQGGLGVPPMGNREGGLPQQGKREGGPQQMMGQKNGGPQMGQQGGPPMMGQPVQREGGHQIPQRFANQDAPIGRRE